MSQLPFAVRYHVAQRHLARKGFALSHWYRLTESIRGTLFGTLCAALVTLPLATRTWWINFRHGDVLALGALAFYFWLIFVILLLGPVLIHDIGRRALRLQSDAFSDFIVGLAASFFLLWFVRLEGAHQIASIRPHLSVAGMIELTVIAAATVIFYFAGLRLLRGRGAIVFLAILVLLSAGIEALARFEAPSRRRDKAIASLSAYLTAMPHPVTPVAPTKRVLMIGIDGMDWAAAAHFVEEGKMPVLASLLRSGRYYEMDNLGMRMSPEIWTAIYTGVPAGRNGVDSFLRWNFRGIAGPVIALPKFGVHSVFFIERLLWYLRPLRLWTSTFVNNTHIKAVPLWTTLSHDGKRIAVINPLPVPCVPEKVAGTFAIVRNGVVCAFSEHSRADFPLPEGSGSPRSYTIGERARLAAAVELLRRERYDVAIYYTEFLDGVQHLNWDFLCPDCFVKGDVNPRAIETTAFEHSDIADGYVQADRSIASIMDAFGQPASVVLVSDHGWDYSDYEHFNDPHGMYVVSPSSPGYGGVASVLSIEPAVLTLAGVPARPNGHQEFLMERPEDEERLKQLKALGYIGR